MFDHIGIYSDDYEKSRKFYTGALEPLGMSMKADFPDFNYCGFGANAPKFWIGKANSDHPASKGVHVAFEAVSRDLVDAFHKAAMDAGGTDNGAPGLRAEYHPNYYGAFVFDPDGNNIEVVCHQEATAPTA